MAYNLPSSALTANVPFPLPATVKNQWLFDRADIEAFKAALLGREPPPRPPVIELVPAARVCLELDISRRALGRRVAAALAAREAEKGGVNRKEAPAGCDSRRFEAELFREDLNYTASTKSQSRIGLHRWRAQP